MCQKCCAALKGACANDFRYGSRTEVPGNVDMLVAGTSCVDYSNLNNKKQDLDGIGESGQTFRGTLG
jgi:hypothetical protein